MERTTLHILGGECRARAEQARVAFALGHHAEVYGDLNELLDRPPHDGIIIAADEGESDSARRLIARLGERGIWLPVVMASSEPDIDRAVAAIKAGALDYLRLPFEMGAFARRLAAILVEAGQHAERRRREVEAQRDIALLSRRERQVLELLSAGCANKEIARRLAISPRTVEIHRGNMMTKLGANHAADAVRLWIDGQHAAAQNAETPGHDPDDLPGIAGRIGAHLAVPRRRVRRRVQRQ
ncbi:MAG TPA: LuxR C-terminal-related transcriptional regulator [Croceibacterium sp.]|nr:LuxR C-terminal-related transcriptional regulator [Croceibacterium sp.]